MGHSLAVRTWVGIAIALGFSCCRARIPDGIFACTTTADCPDYMFCHPDGFCHASKPTEEQPDASKTETDQNAATNRGSERPRMTTEDAALPDAGGSAGNPANAGEPATGAGGAGSEAPQVAAAGAMSEPKSLADGQPCTNGASCASGACVGRTCCAAASCGECETCASGKCEPDPTCQPAVPGTPCDDSACLSCSACATPTAPSCTPVVGPDPSNRCPSAKICTSRSECVAVGASATLPSGGSEDAPLDSRSYAQVFELADKGRLAEVWIAASCLDANMMPMPSRMPPVWIEAVGSDGWPNGIRMSETMVTRNPLADSTLTAIARLSTPVMHEANGQLAVVIGMSSNCRVTLSREKAYTAGPFVHRNAGAIWANPGQRSLLFQALEHAVSGI